MKEKIKLEYAEWANFWFENAPDDTAVRIVLIGDSITNGYRRIVQENLKEFGILVDMAIGSRGVDNPALFAELEYILGSANNKKYRAVHFNNGIHADHITGEAYENGMRDCISLIKKLQPEAEIILVTSTAYSDPAKNGTVIKRNDIVKKLAVEYGLPLNDLYAEVTCKPEYPQPDSVHFSAEGNERLAFAVSEKIKQVLNIKG